MTLPRSKVPRVEWGGSCRVLNCSDAKSVTQSIHRFLFIGGKRCAEFIFIERTVWPGWGVAGRPAASRTLVCLRVAIRSTSAGFRSASGDSRGHERSTWRSQLTTPSLLSSPLRLTFN